MDRRAKAAEYLGRDWTRFESAAESHFDAMRKERGASAIVALGDELREHARRQQPAWPTPVDRAHDLAHHRFLIEIFDRVAARRR